MAPDELLPTSSITWPTRARSMGFRFYDLRHTGHTIATRSGATLKDTMVHAGQSSEKAALMEPDKPAGTNPARES